MSSNTLTSANTATLIGTAASSRVRFTDKTRKRLISKAIGHGLNRDWAEFAVENVEDYMTHENKTAETEHELDLATQKVKDSSDQIHDYLSKHPETTLSEARIIAKGLGPFSLPLPPYDSIKGLGSKDTKEEEDGGKASSDASEDLISQMGNLNL